MISSPIGNVREFGFMPGEKVVDLGSGAGHYTAALSFVLGPLGRVIALDINESSLNKLKNDANDSGRENIEVVLGDIEKPMDTKLRSGIADGAIFTNLLSQLRDAEGAILEAKRVVRQGGKICVVEWVRSRKSVSEPKAKELFESAGLRFKRAFVAGENHYGLIFEKPLQ